MPRIVVFGNPGAGKSTFARALAAGTGLPHISLDAYFWKPGWVESNHAVFRERMEPVLQQESYVLDGNYFTPLGEERMKLADRIFWFDMPRLICMAGVLGRMIRSYGQVRPEMAPGCPERFDLAFLRFVWEYPTRNRLKFAAMIERAAAGEKLTRFTRRAEADAALHQITIHGLNHAAL